MSVAEIILEELELLWVLPLEPRPSCHLSDCSNEAVWNIFWERSCPIHVANPTPYCNYHKELVESKIALAYRRGFRCGMCAKNDIHHLMGHIVKIERISI
jgi:hypothetical protein